MTIEDDMTPEMAEMAAYLADGLAQYMAYVDGELSAEVGLPISACYYGPDDRAGLEWRQGWLAAKAEEEAARRRHPTSLDTRREAMR